MLKILASWRKLLATDTVPGRGGLARLQRVLRRRGLYLVLLALLFSGSYYLVTNKAVFHNPNVRTTFQTSGGALPQAEPQPKEPLAGATTVPPDLQGQSGARLAPATTPGAAPVKETGQPTLAAPVNGRIVAGYGFAYAPAFGDYRFHGGVDMAAPAGGQVRAAGAGEVKQVEYSDAWRYRLVIDNGNGYQTVYANLAAIKVAKGDKVQPGTVLGEVGDPGTTEAGTQPHLHLELLKNGKTVDPVPAMQ